MRIIFKLLFVNSIIILVNAVAKLVWCCLVKVVLVVILE